MSQKRCLKSVQSFFLSVKKMLSCICQPTIFRLETTLWQNHISVSSPPTSPSSFDSFVDSSLHRNIWCLKMTLGDIPLFTSLYSPSLPSLPSFPSHLPSFLLFLIFLSPTLTSTLRCSQGSFNNGAVHMFLSLLITSWSLQCMYDITSHHITSKRPWKPMLVPTLIAKL